ncbi:MAG: c-type cytochrome [Acidobacteriota bacterium]|nr:c-type cytochrome [Acidobacteriota bacterium]
MKTKIKIIVLSIFLVGGAFVFVRSGEMQTKQVETAGQHFKNIKVLNDMPADQMGKVMNLMAASLGVNCNFCHIEGDFSKDGKEEKESARAMIKMNLALNKDYFAGRPEISCNTCHNGKTHPNPAPNLMPKVAEEIRPKQPDAKPLVDDILSRYSQAVGGKDALAKITSRVIKTSRVEPDGKTVESEEITQKGDKLSIVTTYPKAVVTETYDGGSAWKRAGANVIALRADEIEQIKRNAQIFSFADLKTVYQKLDYRFADKIDGRDVYLVTGTLADNSRERLYFDAATNLLVRRVAATPTVLGNYQYQVDYADYKDFGGVKLPTTIRYAMPNISWTRKILEVKNNTAIDDAKFNLPTK